MKKIIDKLNFNIDEFKNNYWYSKTIEIPQFIKNIQPDITENELFDKLLFNVFQTCDLFINQKISQFLTLDLTLEQIIEILSQQRVSNFISSVYTEIKYRLATEKFPEFSQKDKLITSNFSLATSGREFNNFQSLLCAEAIAYLSSPSWNDLKISDKDDYVNILEYVKRNNDNITNRLEKLNQFDSKIEKLLKDNSDSDENLKLSFSKFKSDQLEINDKKENKLSDNVRNFLNKNIESPDYLGPKDGNDYLKLIFDNDDLGIEVYGEEYQTYINPGDVRTYSSNGHIRLCDGEVSFAKSYDESVPKQVINYETVEKWNSSSQKVNSFDKDIEDIKKFNSNEIKTKIDAIGDKTTNNENKIADIYSKLTNNTNANLYQSLKELFKCTEWEIEDKQNKTINDFYNWYKQDDTLINVIFQDKNKNIALSLKNGDENNMFLDFSGPENFWIRDSELIDTYKLETELSKHNLINKYFEADSSNIKVFDFSTNEEFKNIIKDIDFVETLNYLFYKKGDAGARDLVFVGKYTLIEEKPQLQMFNVGNVKEYPFIFYINNTKKIWDVYSQLNKFIEKNETDISGKQDKVYGLDFGSNDLYTLINFSKPQTKIRIGANANQGYLSNIFLDREKDGKNIFRYIETSSSTFVNLSPALQGDTHIEAGINASGKYISLKIDNEELLLDKTKLMKLKSLLN